jgi:general secretion pathway protein A
MYETHFGLRQRPFCALADSGCYYPATTHERAVAQLLEAIKEQEGLALLTGEPGLGKTMLAHCLLDRLGQETITAFLTNSHFQGRTGLLQAILHDLSLPFEGKGDQELRLALTDFLLKNYEDNRRVVLVIDEAQNLTPDQLEELRLLGNLEGRLGKALQIVLLAQPAIMETLRLSELASFQQRLVVRPQLEPLDLHESADYLAHHLRTAGGRPEKVVADEALGIIARAARGVPRLLNQAMHQALSLACAAEAEMVDVEAALEALGALGLSEPEAHTPAGPLVLEKGEREEAQPVLVLDDREHAKTSKEPGLTKETARTHRLFSSPRRPA